MKGYLFQHSKHNASVQFPQSSLIAVVSKYRLGFRISQPFIFCMFMRQLQKSVCYSHRKCVLRNDETFFTPYCFCIFKTVGGYAAAGVELEEVTCLRNPGFFKGFSFCRLNDCDIFRFSSACYELPNTHIAPSEQTELYVPVLYAIWNDQDLIPCSCHCSVPLQIPIC